MPTGKELSTSSTAFVSCSTYSGLEQNGVQFDYLSAVPSENPSTTSCSSTSTCLLQHTSMIWKGHENEADTCDPSEEHAALGNTTQQIIKDERTVAGTDKGPPETQQKTPIRAKRKKRSKKQKLEFLKRMLKSKRQNDLAQQYKSMHASLVKLIKQQQNAPIRNRKERLRRQQLIKKIRTLFAILRKKLRKRDRLQRILLRKRVYRERRRKAQLRLRKIMRVVYFKRQQRIRNMRDLRLSESKRLADNLMLQAAKLRARANRLTGGREVKHTQRKVKKTRKIQEQVKQLVVPVQAAAGDNENMKKSQINIKTSMQQVTIESAVKTRKKQRSRKRKPKCADKHVKKTKALDGKLNGLNVLMQELLSKLSKFGKNPQQKRKKTHRRKHIQSWWRRDRLRAAKIKAI